MAERDPNKCRKLELLVFNGEDPIGWIFRAEKYFLVNHISKNEKMEAVAVCMERTALSWIQWLETRKQLQSWFKFKAELLRRFHPCQQGSVRGGVG